MYKSLKEGWLPLADLCREYNKDKGNANRDLKKLNSDEKEQLGRTWIVNIDAIKKLWG